jgi:hypothetical protein
MPIDDVVCNVEGQDLVKSNKCVNKMSGVKIVYYAFKSDIEIIPSLPETKTTYDDFVILSEGGVTRNGKANSIKMKPGKRFFKYESEVDLGELTYPLQGPRGCRSMLATLETYKSGFLKDILGFMGAASNDELVMLPKMNNGNTHMMGDLERGAEMGDGTTATSGKALTDQNGGNLFFTWPTPCAQIYVGDIDSLLVPAGEGSGS